MIRVRIETTEGWVEVVAQEESDAPTWSEILEVVDRAIKGMGYFPPTDSELLYVVIPENINEVDEE